MVQPPDPNQQRISVEDVKKVGELARLQLDPESLPLLAQQLSTVLGFFAQLDQVSTEGIEPLAHVADLADVFSEDIVHESLPREAALGNAPSRDESFFRVPPVL